VSVYQPKWLDWSTADQSGGVISTPPKKAQVGTDKTDKSPLRALTPPFVSFVSSSPGRFRGDRKGPLAFHEGAQITKNAPLSLTDKTDKRSERTLWEEPDIPDKSPLVRRVVLLAVPDGVPEEWVQGVGDLMVMPPHSAWSDDGWKTLQEDALRFLREWAGVVSAHIGFAKRRWMRSPVEKSKSCRQPIAKKPLPTVAGRRRYSDGTEATEEERD